MKKFNAFTLAEILITLGVIGVVAAMTMPILIKKYQQQVTVTQLKKAYTELNQAVKFAEVEYGDIADWDWNSDINSFDFFDKYFSRYIRIREQTYRNRNIKYYEISGKEETRLGFTHDGSSYPIVTTSSGYTILPVKYNDSIMMIIDINGDKKPNTFGKDVFIFLNSRDLKRFVPFAWDDKNWGKSITDRNILKNGTSSSSIYNYQCNKQGRGMWCGALIMVDGWKIAPDYPW